MSNLILHPIPHSWKQGMFATDDDRDKAISDFHEVVSTAVQVMTDYLETGIVVVDSWNGSHDKYDLRYFLLKKPDDKLVNAGEISTEFLTGIEVRIGHSKSLDESFDYLRCNFGFNAFVNIFDHPEKSRNTWSICQRRGWTWITLQGAIMSSYPVAATLTYDGQWFSLIDIVSKTEYDLFCEHIDTMNGAKDNDE